MNTGLQKFQCNVEFKIKSCETGYHKSIININLLLVLNKIEQKHMFKHEQVENSKHMIVTYHSSIIDEYEFFFQCAP